MRIFNVVGVGPGHPDYTIPAALKIIESADIVAASPRLLNTFASSGQQQFIFKADVQELMDFIRSNMEYNSIAVLVTGDPGYHSLLGAISERFDSSEYNVIPGISSFQLAMARMGKPWQNDLLLSFHGRTPENGIKEIIKVLKQGNRAILLTDRKQTPSVIAGYLVAEGYGESIINIAENLTEPGEAFYAKSAESLAGIDQTYWKDRLCIMIIQHNTHKA